MIFVSFNVNSVRLRLHQLTAVIAKHEPDVIGLQETKVTDDDFPVEAIRAMGYEVAYHGQKTHYGVALMSRLPMRQVEKGFSSDDDNAQKRLISADITLDSGQTVRVINGYFPQGEKRDHAIKFPAKQKFYADLLAKLSKDYKSNEFVLVMGDFNIAPVDEDLGIGADNVKRWLRDGKTSFLPEEREWLKAISDWGLIDTFRAKHPHTDDLFSWFDYRSRGFERQPKRGLRIDHLYASAPLAAKLENSGIDYDVRAMEKPSDHCPVWSSFAD